MQASPDPDVPQTLKLYRVVHHRPPTPADFRPDVERGLQSSQHAAPVPHQGMSAYTRRRDARALAKWMKRKWGYRTLFVAEIEVAKGSLLGAHPDPPPAEHFCVWGDSSFLAQVATIVEEI